MIKFSPWFLCALVWCSSFTFAQEPVSLLIIDTQGKDRYYYRNLIMLTDSVGFKTDYKNIYDLLENSDINQYQALFFMLSPAMIDMSLSQRFFNKLYCLFPAHPTHAIPEHCLNVLRTFAQQPDKAVGLILPGRINYSAPLKQHATQAIFAIGQFHQLSSDLQSLLNSFIMYITDSDTRKGALFGTSLINRSPAKITPFVSPKTVSSACMPLQTTHYSTEIQSALPIGLLIHHEPHNTIYLVSKSSEFDFADITEHLFKNPLAFCHRTELLKAAQETLRAFHDAYRHHTIPESVPTCSLPAPLTLEYLQHEKQRITTLQKKQVNQQQYAWLFGRPIACTWFDPYDCFAHEDTLQKLTKVAQEYQKTTHCSQNIKSLVEQLALKRGVQIIYDAQFNLVWFECIPEWYLSPHGLRKDQKEAYITRMKTLGRELAAFFATHQMPLPKIFLGLNLTSNFKSHPVANPVQSISGTSYTKIPSPFDIGQFWKPELLDMVEAFIVTFKNWLPIDGIFFDFEMYHAQDQTGSYTDLMDFSHLAWKTYCTYTKNRKASQISTVKNRLDYLQQHKKFTDYFTILEQASRDLGIGIKRHLRHLLPNVIFAAYAPTLPSSWFYRGIMSGLSSPSEPLILATFNTDYASHYAWLTQHHIYLIHGTAIMLSKLQMPSDFNLITTQLTHHDFVWYNRPSRMIYQYDHDELAQVWWAIEATPAPSRKTMRGIRMHHLTW